MAEYYLPKQGYFFIQHSSKGVKIKYIYIDNWAI